MARCARPAGSRRTFRPRSPGRRPRTGHGCESSIRFLTFAISSRMILTSPMRADPRTSPPCPHPAAAGGLAGNSEAPNHEARPACRSFPTNPLKLAALEHGRSKVSALSAGPAGRPSSGRFAIAAPVAAAPRTSRSTCSPPPAPQPTGSPCRRSRGRRARGARRPDRHRPRLGNTASIHRGRLDENAHEPTPRSGERKRRLLVATSQLALQPIWSPINPKFFDGIGSSTFPWHESLLPDLDT